MNKILRYSFVALMAMLVGNVMADDITDELTLTTFGVTGTSYTDVSNKSATSSAVYSANMAGGNNAIQLRSSNNNSGIISTTSGGKIKSIKIEWNSNTADARVLKVYGSSTAYSSPADLYGDNKGTEIASFTKSDGTKTETITGDYQYIGLRSNSGAMYIDKITIVWTTGGGSTKKATTIVFSGDYKTKFTPGLDGESTALPTATVKAGDAVVTNNVNWTLTKGSNWYSDEDPSINNTKTEVNIKNHSYGDLTLTAKYEGDATYEESNKNYTIKVYKGRTNIKEILEDYPIVGSDTWTGKQAEWTAGQQTSYWQVDVKSETDFTSKEALVTYVKDSYTYIRDNNGSLLLYGSNLGFNIGDKISGDKGQGLGFGAIYGKLKAYNGLLELEVSENEFVVKSSNNEVVPKTIKIDKLTQENMNEYLKIENAEYVSANGKNLTFKVGETPFAVYNQFNVDIAALEAGSKYTLEGLGCIYYKNNTLTNQLYLTKFDISTNINTIKTDADVNAPAYNLAGQKVEKSYKGVVVKNGKKFVNK